MIEHIGRRVNVIQKVLVYTAIAFAVFSVFGFFILPPLAKSILTKQLTTALHRQVVIERIKVNPYLLTADVQGFTVANKDGGGAFLSFDELFIECRLMSVFKRGAILGELRLVRPYLNVVRNKDLSYNFSDLLEAKKPKTTGKPLSFSLNNIQVQGGAVDFTDLAKRTKSRLDEITVTVPFISNLDYYCDTFVMPYFSARLNGRAVSLAGESKPFSDSMETLLKVEVHNLDLPHYLEYLPPQYGSSIKSGRFSMKGEISYMQHWGGATIDSGTGLQCRKTKGRPLLVFKGDLALKDFRMDSKGGGPLAKLDRLDVNVAEAELFGRDIRLKKISIQSPEIHVVKDKTGTMNIMALLPKETAPPKEKAAAPEEGGGPLLISIASVRLDSGKMSFTDNSGPAPFGAGLDPLNIAVNDISVEKKEQKPDSGRKENPMDVRVGSFGVYSSAAAVSDERTSPPVRMSWSDISLLLKKFSMAENNMSDISAAMHIEKTGSLTGTGSIGVNPIAAKLRVEMKDAPMLPLQPYFTDRVRIEVLSGLVSGKGDVELAFLKDKGMHAKYSGDVSITRLRTVDKEGGDDFLKWKSLYVNLDSGVNPWLLQINKVSLTDFYSKILIRQDGTLNVTGIYKPPPPTPHVSPVTGAPAGPPGQPPGPVTVKDITLQGGRVNFTDRHIKPSYTMNLTAVGGRISGMSSTGGNADMDLKALLNGDAPVEITGKINPLSKDLYVDLTMSLEGLDLSQFSPYSGKYIGYAIEKGQLSLGLKYLIVKKALDSTNKITVDQLTLGEKIESPNATKLPVRLAIALLKDRHGVINLDFPVTGRTDDPKFSLGGVIWMVIKNLLTKIVTSPFALLGKLFGGGEELGYVEFGYGLDKLDPVADKKLDTLSKALTERPELKLEITGHADPVKDKDGLRDYLFQRKIKEQKFRKMKEDERPAEVDDVQVQPDEYDKYLKLAYKAEPFEKPRNIIGMVKSLPAPEMEKLMMTHIEVNDETLRQLADRRAEVVKDYLLKTGKVVPARVFTVRAASLAPEKKEGRKDSRVDFSLK